MEKLRIYINGLEKPVQTSFAERCNTTIGYLRKAISVGQRLNESLCINIERETAGEIRCEDLRPDVDWAYLRRSTETAVSK